MNWAEKAGKTIALNAYADLVGTSLAFGVAHLVALVAPDKEAGASSAHEHAQLVALGERRAKVARRPVAAAQ